MVSNLGPNAPLIGKPYSAELQTPALMLDLTLFESNLQRMATNVHQQGRLLRPHVKAHKSSTIAHWQVAAGAIGLSCATLREIEVMSDQGLDSLLLTTPVITHGASARLAAARSKVGEIILAIDSRAQLESLASVADPRRPFGILIELDVGQRRTGVTSTADAVRLAQLVRQTPGLRYRGLQAYYGHLQHVAAFAERRARISDSWSLIERVVVELEAAGLPPEIVSGGGTGSHLIDLHGPFTEIQPGSYCFMDRQYEAIEFDQLASQKYDNALLVAARVVSANTLGQVIIDVGTKGMSTDAGTARVLAGAPTDTRHVFMGDEHSALIPPEGSSVVPSVGDLVLLVPPHCDPTVNLHDRLHVTRGSTLVDIWPIEARGY